jgi:putative heme-binding domain-containing protein
MGVLRSAPFEAPQALSFYTAGHNGPPGETLPKRNVMRLLDAKTGEVLAEAFPPRDDVARKVTWDLKEFAGRAAVFEATDAQDGSGYAWLAFGRFDPPVVKLPSVGPDVIRLRQQSAAEIAGALHLTALESRLGELLSGASVDAQARAAAARALAAISPDKHVKRLGAIAADPRVPPALRDAVSQALGELNSAEGRAELAAALSVAPRQLQVSLALALARSTPGAETLLKAVEEGKASPRLLLEPPVRARLEAAKPANLDSRLAQLTRGLPAVSDELQKVIDQRRNAFDPASASAERGAKVFAAQCAVCHKVKDLGATIGPQLDGVGKRGADRIAEDVLDPNRNVDAAFRQTIVQLQDGDSLAGLVRREEGELLVLADSTGKEFSVPRSKVRRRAASTLSPMPSNFAETIPPRDFNDLLAFLLGS